MLGRQTVDTSGGGAQPIIIPVWYQPVLGVVNIFLLSSPQTDTASRYFVWHHPLCLLCLPDIIACDMISQAFPLHICTLQAIKDWRWEWLGNEAKNLPIEM